jgi:hypothetical protein
MALVKRQRHPSLSFVTCTYTQRGRPVGVCDFDVPDERYAQGWRTGTQAAVDLFEALRQGDAFPCGNVIFEAVRIYAEARGNDAPSGGARLWGSAAPWKH